MTLQTDPAYVFGRSSDEYMRLTGQAALIGPMTERLFRDAGITPGMRVLDVGSGVGDVALLAARLVGPHGSVVGVDLDGSALQAARARTGRLGLQNLTFIEGDVRSAEIGVLRRGGRAARAGLPGRPGRGVRRDRRARPPGWDRRVPGTRPSPRCALAIVPRGDALGPDRPAVETFARAGTRVRMGRQLHGSYLTAGLPAPTMREEAIVGGGPGFAGYAWLAGIARSLGPLMDKLEIASTRQLDLDTLAERVRDDAVTRGAVVWGPALIDAYARRP